MTDVTTGAAEILAGIEDALGSIFERIRWAEDEIAQAQLRHPEDADKLYHSFALLSGDEASARMGVEVVYRAHVREILERVAHGEDTRPGTALEVVIGLLAAAERAPLSHEGFGLCARLWAAAGLPDHDGFADKLDHIEALHAARIDSEEIAARHACRNDTRKLGRIECDGWHHGRETYCVFPHTAA